MCEKQSVFQWNLSFYDFQFYRDSLQDIILKYKKTLIVPHWVCFLSKNELMFKEIGMHKNSFN